MTDIFRDTWVRYLGYANEIGEAFRPVIPHVWVHRSYYVAMCYVLADTFDKSYKMYEKEQDNKKVAIAAGDALLWQSLASVMIPGFTINRISAATLFALRTFRVAKVLGPRSTCVVAVFVGIASIPLIIGPIDHGVTVLMDNTYRKAFPQ